MWNIRISEKNFLFIVIKLEYKWKGFPGGSDNKESDCNAGDWDSIPGSGRSPGERNGSPRQYSCLENSMGRGAPVGYSPRGCKELDTTE